MLDDAVDVLNSIDQSVFLPELYKLKASIYLKRNQNAQPVEEFLKIIDMKKILYIPYSCSNCRFSSEQWTGRCPSCKKWNTYYFDLQESCKIR